jgi:hypothetical protein
VSGGAGGRGGGFGAGGGGGGGAGTSELTPLLLNRTIGPGVSSDGNGFVSITWFPPTTPVCLDQQVNVPRDSPGVHVQLRCERRPTSYLIDAYPDHGFLDHRNYIAGTFTYVPVPGYVGADRITFQGISHGQISTSATVTFEVQ